MNAEQKKNRKFAGDLGLYAAGNLGSKLIMFLLLPFYTHYIHDTADYGYYDLCTTIVMGMLPVIGMQLGDAGFRFLTGVENRGTRTEIISFILKKLAFNTLLFAALSAMIGCFTEIPYFPLVVMYALTQTIYDTLMQIMRGLGNIRSFMTISIANSFITALSGIVMVTMMDMGILGIFLSVVTARSLSIALCLCSSSIPRLFRHDSHATPRLRRQILSYSLPMIPAAVCQWLIPAAIVMITTHSLGLGETGLYAVSAKFASIMFVLTHIFYQTWQQNAIEFYDSADRSSFFSGIFRLYFYLLTAMTCILPFAIRLNYPWLVDDAYEESSRFLFLNTLLVMLSALTLFFETGYQCAARTRRVMGPDILAACVIIAINLWVAPHAGVEGMLACTCAVYLALLGYRIIDTRHYLQIHAGGDIALLAGVTAAAGTVYHCFSGAPTDVAAIAAVALALACCGGRSLTRSITDIMKHETRHNT